MDLKKAPCFVISFDESFNQELQKEQMDLIFNVNWKMYDKLVEERGENEQLAGLINVGSCGLHVVHEAFTRGAQKTKWGVDSILKVLYKLFDESPAKREGYSAITGSNMFPLQFCGNRWVEDKKLQKEFCKFGQMWRSISRRP